MADSNDETVKARTWDEFIGQKRIVHRLQTHIAAAIAEERPLEHLLLTGPPGSGKSTLAELVAISTGVPFVSLDATSVTGKHILSALAYPNFEGGVLFLDEIHALSKKDQEVMLPILGRGIYISPTGREFLIPNLTVIGATTERDKVIKPLIGRFVIRPEVEPYTDSELGQIVCGMAVKAGTDMTAETAVLLGRACGGVPRNGKEFVFAARALASIHEGRPPSATEILDFCSVDPDGLTELHRRYLALLTAQGGRAGQKTIEGILQIPGSYARDLERLLIDKGFITYTPGGRILTPRGVGRVKGEDSVVAIWGK